MPRTRANTQSMFYIFLFLSLLILYKNVLRMRSVIYKVFLSVTCSYVLKKFFKLHLTKYNQFLLFVVVRFYKVVLNTEKLKHCS